MFTERDLQLFQRKGISTNQVEKQLAIFSRGVPYIILDRPCTIGDGVTRLPSSKLGYFWNVFNEGVLSGRVKKFVPASGAATRMFRSLLAYRATDSHQKGEHSETESLSEAERKSCYEVFKNIRSFAFFEDLETECSRQGENISALLRNREYGRVLEYLLFLPGLNYARLPKGLIKFHRYPTHSRTPLDEHIIESLSYAKDSTNTVRLHFTISPEHVNLLERHLADIHSRFELGTVRLEITCSPQKTSTETLAVDLENQPFRGNGGDLVFRPAGHGALLENLNDLQGDIVFIKNIDNVVHDRLLEATISHKKALGGYLIDIQRQVFTYLRKLMTEELNPENSQHMMAFIQKVLRLSMPDGFAGRSKQNQKEFFINLFNRPLRVCGVVPNTGEPGGGPFWVKHPNGNITPQIVESSQVDARLEDQNAIWKSSTHFNPVDLVCGVRDFQGKPFLLSQFSDPDTVIISRKSFEGRELKALELPGLWNGAMANWNTIFVEVPSLTFNPVKTISDLLRPEHQPIS